MEKNKLNRFISKYSLSGKANSVIWKIKNNKLETSFVTENKSLLGKAEVDNFTFEDAEIGIYDTDQLQKLLNVLSDNISLSLRKFAEKPLSLNVESENTSVEFVLSDTSVIPEPPKMKKIPEFETEIKVDSSFVNSFIKGKTALPDNSTFTVVKNTDGCNVVIGHSNTTTNRVNISVENIKCGIDNNLSFDADLFKEILQSNRECSNAVLQISNEGLAKIKFNVDDFVAEYFMVAKSEDQ